MIDNLICKPKTLVGIYKILGFVWAVFYTQKYANPFGHNHHHRQLSVTMGQLDNPHEEFFFVRKLVKSSWILWKCALDKIVIGRVITNRMY